MTSPTMPYGSILTAAETATRRAIALLPHMTRLSAHLPDDDKLQLIEALADELTAYAGVDDIYRSLASIRNDLRMERQGFADRRHYQATGEVSWERVA